MCLLAVYFQTVTVLFVQNRERVENTSHRVGDEAKVCPAKKKKIQNVLLGMCLFPAPELRCFTAF